MNLFPWNKEERPKNVTKNVVIRVPSEPVLYRFKAMRTFHWPQNGSVYCKGELYSVRQGNKELDDFVKEWEKEDKGYVKRI